MPWLTRLCLRDCAFQFLLDPADLLPAVEALPELAVLDLTNVPCDAADVKALSRLPHIRQVVLTGSVLLDEAPEETMRTVEMLLRVQRARPHVTWLVDGSVESTIAD